jgi:hypothetical protein
MTFSLFRPRPKAPRQCFTPEEDARLRELVQEHGENQWGIIAGKMGRSDRQCRERYGNYLCPRLTRRPWTEAEDRLVIDSVRTLGPHWSAIGRLLRSLTNDPDGIGRSEVDVKNRWYSHLRHRASGEFAAIAVCHYLTLLSSAAAAIRVEQPVRARVTPAPPVTTDAVPEMADGANLDEGDPWQILEEDMAMDPYETGEFSF